MMVSMPAWCVRPAILNRWSRIPNISRNKDRVDFIVANLCWKHSNVIKFYNKHGTPEQGIKEGKYALQWIRLSCHDFDDNQARLQLFVMAYNIGNFLRRRYAKMCNVIWEIPERTV
jgi:hypothetical protein